MLLITYLECFLRIHKKPPSMIHSETTYSTGLIGLTPGMQILLILWFQGMYHQERTRRSLFKKVVHIYGMSHISSEYVLMAYSGDV